MRPGDLSVHQGTLGSLGCTPRILEFIRGHWVHWGAPWGSLGSSRVAGFLRVRPAGRQGSLGVEGLIVGGGGALGYSGVVGFIVMRLRGRRFYP